MSDKMLLNQGPFTTSVDKQLTETDWRFGVTAEGMLGSIHALQDEYAQEIFDLWFNGKQTVPAIFEDAKWAGYMRANEQLQQQINDQLTFYAALARDKVLGGSISFQHTFNISFHAEVGGESGGYTTGYGLLHGTNKSVGDFQITGRLTVPSNVQQGSPVTVKYEDLSFIFNDIIDGNKKYSLDVQFLRLARNMALYLNTGPPKDYILRIKWKTPSPILINVPSKTSGLLPPFKEK